MSGKLPVLVYSICVIVGLLASAIEPLPAAAAAAAQLNSRSSLLSAAINSPNGISQTPNISCNLGKGNGNETKLLDKVNVMKGRKYEWEDRDHKYYFSVCSTASSTLTLGATDGIIQVNKESNNIFVLGRLNDVDLEGVENIIRMTYNDGDPYQRACNRNKRTAVIYFVCDPNQKQDEFTMIDENNDRDTDRCAYIFELKTNMTCNKSQPPSTPAPTSSSSTSSSTTTTSSSKTTNQSTQTTASSSTSTPVTPVTKPSSSSSSSSSSSVSSTAASSSSSPSSNKISNKLGVIPIILISLTSVLAVYFIFGAIYQRYVNRARGWEQLPNYTLWLSLGSRLNECCRFGNRTTQIHSYENINDRISDDENLLN